MMLLWGALFNTQWLKKVLHGQARVPYDAPRLHLQHYLQNDRINQGIILASPAAKIMWQNLQYLLWPCRGCHHSQRWPQWDINTSSSVFNKSSQKTHWESWRSCSMQLLRCWFHKLYVGRWCQCHSFSVLWRKKSQRKCILPLWWTTGHFFGAGGIKIRPTPATHWAVGSSTYLNLLRRNCSQAFTLPIKTEGSWGDEAGM